MADEGRGSGAITRGGVLAGRGKTWDEERRGTRKDVGRGTTRNEERPGQGTTSNQGPNGARQQRRVLPRPPSSAIPRVPRPARTPPGSTAPLPGPSSTIRKSHVPRPTSRSSPEATTLPMSLVFRALRQEEEPAHGKRNSSPVPRPSFAPTRPLNQRQPKRLPNDCNYYPPARPRPMNATALISIRTPRSPAPTTVLDGKGA
jgi:hypothetical protein